MDSQIAKVLHEARTKIESAKVVKDLEKTYIELFGKDGLVTNLTKQIKDIKSKDRATFGKAVNAAKKEIEEYFAKKRSALSAGRLAIPIDITAPGTKQPLGHLHLVSQAIEEIVAIFARLGFTLQSYPEIDWDWYAFESLNMPKGHPARDEWETFFVKGPANPKYGNQVLTPHTSNGQVREMERAKKSLPAGRQTPIRMINIARCYRRQIDISHTPMFHQFEGLLIDQNVSIANLRGTLDFFTANFFGPGRKTRLRPYHFRFTEPSFEVDVTCDICLGRGCRLCKSGWLELGGAGMIHPKVLTAGRIDPTKYSGFAFGWGIERTIAMKTNIDDIRILYQNDIRFLEQF